MSETPSISAQLREALAQTIARARRETPRPSRHEMEALARGVLEADAAGRVRRALALHAGAVAEYEAVRGELGLPPIGSAEAEPDAAAAEDSSAPPTVVLPFRTLRRLAPVASTSEPWPLAAAGDAQSSSIEHLQGGSYDVLAFEHHGALVVRVEREGMPVPNLRVALRETVPADAGDVQPVARYAHTDAAGEAPLGSLDQLPPPRVGGRYVLFLG